MPRNEHHFFKCVWRHDNATDPIEIYCEVGSDGREVRKVERFPDQSLGWADQSTSTDGEKTWLSTVEIPTLDAINQDDEFHAVAITQDEFDRVFEAAKTLPLRDADNEPRW